MDRCAREFLDALFDDIRHVRCNQGLWGQVDLPAER